MSIERFDKSSRMSQAVVHGNTVYLAGQVAADGKAPIKEQTQSVLAKIDALLAQTGSSKAQLLQAVIYLADMRHFQAMNEVWDGWVDAANPPARATVGAPLAAPGYLIEIMVIAAR